MKLLQTILALFIIALFISCEDNAPDQGQVQSSFYLKGVVNRLDSLNFEYFEKQDAPRGISSSQTPSQILGDSYLNSVDMIFGLDQNYFETIGINFNFKFDKSENVNLLSNISDLDHLEELMTNANWGYGENYEKTDATVDIYYESLAYLAKWQKYNSSNVSSTPVNSVNDFHIESIERYTHFMKGDGLRVSGTFDCVLYNRTDPEDSLVMHDMKFKGFINLLYCGQQQCE